MTPLRQSTQIKVRVGPFMDATNAITPEAGVTLAGADQAELLKANGAATVDLSGATWAAITGADGWYDLTLTTSHTDTVGELTVVVQDESVCRPVFMQFQVVEEAVYDELYAASAGIAKSVLDAPTASHEVAGSFGEMIGLTAADTDELQTLWTTGGAARLELQDVPTTAEFEARTLVAAAYFDPAADTVANVTTVATLTGHTAQTGDSFARLGAPAGASIAADIAGVSVGTTVPVLMTAVPKTRTWKLKKTNAGLVGEDSLAIQVGEAKVLAVDFANDLATNGLLTGITSVAIKSGLSGGVTFDTANDGVAFTQYKCKMTGVTAGTYVINVVVTYDDSDGGGTAEADVTLIVVD